MPRTLARAEIPGHVPDSLRLERDGDLFNVTLARPDKRNALNDETFEGIEQVFANIPKDVRAVVIAGDGDHFCAGLDLSMLLERSASEGMYHSIMGHRGFDRMQFGKVPVVAVLHGAVIGGGLELAASAHIRVAERSAFYALPEGQRGIFVGGGGAVRLPRLMGVSRMMEMMMTGRVMSAEEGHAVGLSHYLVEPGQGMAKAIELARKVAQNAPMTNFSLMHALPRIADLGHEEGMLMEAMVAGIAQAEPMAKERVKAFLEKRAGKVQQPGD